MNGPEATAGSMCILLSRIGKNEPTAEDAVIARSKLVAIIPDTFNTSAIWNPSPSMISCCLIDKYINTNTNPTVATMIPLIKPTNISLKTSLLISFSSYPHQILF